MKDNTTRNRAVKLIVAVLGLFVAMRIVVYLAYWLADSAGYINEGSGLDSLLKGLSSVNTLDILVQLLIVTLVVVFYDLGARALQSRR